MTDTLPHGWRKPGWRLARQLRRQLLFEISPAHPLALARLRVIGQAGGSDHVLVEAPDAPHRYYLVYLTWSGKEGDATIEAESDSWPEILFQLSLQAEEADDAAFSSGELWVSRGAYHAPCLLLLAGSDICHAVFTDEAVKPDGDFSQGYDAVSQRLRQAGWVKVGTDFVEIVTASDPPRPTGQMATYWLGAWDFGPVVSWALSMGGEAVTLRRLYPAGGPLIEFDDPEAAGLFMNEQGAAVINGQIPLT